MIKPDYFELIFRNWVKRVCLDPDGKKDNAHLQQAGAKAFAGLLAGLIRSYERDDKLDKVKAELAQNMFVAL